ncbi:MAG: DUF4338 domain-containing protein [Roseovarius sp.]|nr:DUF4338 domain-containing protein [Roseovarius sp.]
MAALAALAAEGAPRLPPEGPGRGVSRSPRLQSASVAAPVGLPSRVDRVRGLELHLATEDAGRPLPSRMLAEDHPLGACRHAGRQLRHPVGSAHGWPGGFVFAGPAPLLAARDRWIGRDAAGRSAGIDRIVGMSRFPLRKGVSRRNLASKALSPCLRRLGDDFLESCGVRPLPVEALVGPGHGGGGHCAAGWTCAGETAGRGRRSETGDRVPPKAVWPRPLARNWRRALGVEGSGAEAPPRPRTALGPGEGLDGDRWAVNEFGGAAPRGKPRDRLVASAAVQAASPSKTFFTAARGNQALVTGYCRMIGKADREHVGLTPEGILAGHGERTMRRMRGAGKVLPVQDGTDLNFATRHGCDGLGAVSRNGRGGAGSGTPGMHMHGTFAVGADGIPLGVPRIGFDCPDGSGGRVGPVEGRKSARWLRGWRDGSALLAEASATGSRAGDVRAVSVMDREGDIAAPFAERRDGGGADLPVRAKTDRVLAEGDRLFARVRSPAARSRREVRVDRASSRRAARGQRAFAGREARRANVDPRWMELDIPVPRNERGRLGPAPFRLTAARAFEPSPPSGAEGLEWLLSATPPVRGADDAREVLDMYALRWRTGDWHRILKTGREIGKSGFHTAGRMKAAVTISAVIAWRLAALTLMGRDTPELPACETPSASNPFRDRHPAGLRDRAGPSGSRTRATGEPGRPGGRVARRGDAPGRPSWRPSEPPGGSDK